MKTEPGICEVCGLPSDHTRKENNVRKCIICLTRDDSNLFKQDPSAMFKKDLERFRQDKK